MQAQQAQRVQAQQRQEAQRQALTGALLGTEQVTDEQTGVSSLQGGLLSGRPELAALAQASPEAAQAIAKGLIGQSFAGPDVPEPRSAIAKLVQDRKDNLINDRQFQIGLNRINAPGLPESLGKALGGIQSQLNQAKLDKLQADTKATESATAERERKQLESGLKRLKTAKGREDTANFAVSRIRQLSEALSPERTGRTGSLLELLQDPTQIGLKKRVETIESLVARDTLNELRANSPSGGALGATSDRDISLLTTAAGSLDLTQDAATIAGNLATIGKLYERIGAVSKLEKFQGKDFRVVVPKQVLDTLTPIELEVLGEIMQRQEVLRLQ